MLGIQGLTSQVGSFSQGSGESWKGFKQGWGKIRMVLEGSPWSLKKVKGWQSCWVELEGSRRKPTRPEGISGAPGLCWV